MARLNELVPIKDLKPGPQGLGHWQATGSDPQFLLRCDLPAGWLHVRVRLQTDAHGRMEWYTLTSSDDALPVLLERAHHRPGAQHEYFVHVPHPIQSLRFDPLDVEGTFVLQDMSVERLSGPSVFFEALKTKLRLLWRHHMTLPALRNAARLLVMARWGALREKLLGALAAPHCRTATPYDPEAAYARWRKARASSGYARLATSTLPDSPLISLVMIAFEASPPSLRQTLASINAQQFPAWELLVCSRDGQNSGKLAPADVDRDNRVRPLHASPAESALAQNVFAQIRGRYFAFIEPGDTIAPHALAAAASALETDPSIDMLYTDEDQILSNGEHGRVWFKPAWSPELFHAAPYTLRLCLFRTDRVRALNAFDLGTMGSRGHGVTLQLAARAARVGHIPDVLYHATTPSAMGPASPPSPLRGMPRVSILVPTAFGSVTAGGRRLYLVERCLRSIRDQTTYTNYEIVLLHNGQTPHELTATLTGPKIRHYPYCLPFNWADSMNRAADLATGEYLLCLDDDTEVLTPGWLQSLLQYGQQPGVGAVGARLLYPDGRLQHAGVTLLRGQPVHSFAGAAADDAGYFGGNVLPRNCTAVTSACMLTPAAVFRAAGGFRSSFRLYYNDIDYCLRLGERGFRIVYNPYAELRHYEAATKRSMQAGEIALFQELWSKRLPLDPFHNPNLSVDSPNCQIETDPERIRAADRRVRYGAQPTAITSA